MSSLARLVLLLLELRSLTLDFRDSNIKGFVPIRSPSLTLHLAAIPITPQCLVVRVSVGVVLLVVRYFPTGFFILLLKDECPLVLAILHHNSAKRFALWRHHWSLQVLLPRYLFEGILGMTARSPFPGVIFGTSRRR